MRSHMKNKPLSKMLWTVKIYILGEFLAGYDSQLPETIPQAICRALEQHGLQWNHSIPYRFDVNSR